MVAARRRNRNHQLLPRRVRRTPSRRWRESDVAAPAYVIWGERDRYVRAELAEPDRADVPQLERVVRLPDASHWVQQDEPERVAQLLVEFFTDEHQGASGG